MHRLRKTINELYAMLKLHEQTFPKNNAHALHDIRAGKVQKVNKHKIPQPQMAAKGQNHEKKKNKLAYAPKPKIPPLPKREDPAKDLICMSVMRQDIGRGICYSRDDIFEIDLSNSFTNESFMYAVSNKRAKLDLDSALMWHCLLGHINKKRIEKLQHGGLLNSTDPRLSRNASLHKHKVFETFKVFQKEVENQLGKTIKLLHFDRGVEYMSQEFLDHLKDHRIFAHRIPPYTPQHNGVSERKKRTILDMVRSMMSQTTLPKSFWDYALETAARILNMGCEALVKPDTLTKPDKLKPRSTKCIFIGYPKETMGYSFYCPLENKVLVSRNAEFLENSLITQEAYNEVYDLVELPLNDKTVGSKWLFKKKTDMDRVVHTYKARFVAKGYTQTLRIDYEETFSPVADIRAIRILIAISAFYDNEIWQMDVKNAFLNGYLSEEVYMEQPEGSIMYAVRCTLHDVSFAQNVTSRFQQNLGDLYWTIVKNILNYLRNNKDMFLVYGGDIKRELRSAKQSIFATSSAEAEYIAAFDAFKEAVWVRKFISRLGITKGARHFRAKVHYIREVIEYGDVKLEKVYTYDSLADPFTKALAFPKYSEHTRNIRMLSASSLM
nr:retrotransposon protein, putative, Ty1-copia subclass [Tanacetum cinerariifolium]